MTETKYKCFNKRFAEENEDNTSENFSIEYEKCLKCSGEENSKNNKKFECFTSINENELEKKV